MFAITCSVYQQTYDAMVNETLPLKVICHNLMSYAGDQVNKMTQLDNLRVGEDDSNLLKMIHCNYPRQKNFHSKASQYTHTHIHNKFNWIAGSTDNQLC